MEKCCAVAFFNAQCIILHLCGDREHIFGFAQAHGGDTHLHSHSEWTTIIMRFWYLYSFAWWNCEHRFVELPIGWEQQQTALALQSFMSNIIKADSEKFKQPNQTNDIIYTEPNGTHFTCTHTGIPYTCYDVNWKHIKNRSHNGMRQMFSRLIKNWKCSQPTNPDEPICTLNMVIVAIWKWCRSAAVLLQKTRTFIIMRAILVDFATIRIKYVWSHK